MPERHKLTVAQVRSLLKSGPHGKWVVVNVADGAILGDGDGSLQALRDAKSKHPKMDLDEVAVIFVSAFHRHKRPSARSLSDRFHSFISAPN